jgi:hypothetical protein
LLVRSDSIDFARLNVPYIAASTAPVAARPEPLGRPARTHGPRFPRLGDADELLAARAEPAHAFDAARLNNTDVGVTDEAAFGVMHRFFGLVDSPPEEATACASAARLVREHFVTSVAVSS